MKKLSEKMSVREVSQFLLLSEKTVKHFAKSGTIPGYRLNRKWYFERNILELWVIKKIKEETMEKEKNGTKVGLRRNTRKNPGSNF